MDYCKSCKNRNELECCKVCTMKYNETPTHYEPITTIKDSGDRTQFSTGAVRDMQGEDKGACHLLPLDVISAFYDGSITKIFNFIQWFLDDGDIDNLYLALEAFAEYKDISIQQMILEVSIHYRDGAKKYKPNNWKLGIPVSSFISSGVRHLLKHIDLQCDERHDRAFVWNMLGAIWTMAHKPELNDLQTGVTSNGNQEKDKQREEA